LEKGSRTKTFREGFNVSDAFSKDFEVFLSMPIEVAKLVNERVASKDIFLEEGAKILGPISEKTGYSSTKIATALRIVNFFVEQLQEGEDIHDLLHDLQVEGYLDEKTATTATSLFSTFSDLWRAIQERKSERKYEIFGAPVLERTVVTTNLRFQPKKEFDIHDDLNSYNPKIEKLIPIALAEMQFQKMSGSDTVSFQVNLKMIREFIKVLQAAEKELMLLKEIASKIEQK